MLHLMMLEHQVNRLHGERTQEAATERALRSVLRPQTARLAVVRAAAEDAAAQERSPKLSA